MVKLEESTIKKEHSESSGESSESGAIVSEMKN